MESRSAERNRVVEVLETANIELAGVASDVFRVSGMQMMRALAEGESNPKKWRQWPKDVCAPRFPSCNGFWNYYMLSDQVSYNALGNLYLDYLDRLNQQPPEA